MSMGSGELAVRFGRNIERSEAGHGGFTLASLNPAHFITGSLNTGSTCVRGLMPYKCLLLFDGDGETVWNNFLHSSRGHISLSKCEGQQSSVASELSCWVSVNCFHSRFL